MACGGGCNTTRCDRFVMPGGAACSRELAAFAASPAVVFIGDTLGGFIGAWLTGYCQTGNLDAANQRAARSFAQSLRIAAVVYPIAAVVFPVAAVALLPMVPVVLAMIPIMDALGKGRAPVAADITRALSTSNAALGNSAPLKGEQVEEAAAFVALAASDKGTPLPSLAGIKIPGDTASKAALRAQIAKARESKKAQLKTALRAQYEAAKAKAKAKAKELSKAKGRMPPLTPGESSLAEPSKGGLVASMMAAPLPIKLLAVGALAKGAAAVLGGDD
jgi:hypothetical protein